MYRSHPHSIDTRALRAETHRVVAHYTQLGLLFTSLDVSNAVKCALPAARHRDVAVIVRERYQRGAMGDYVRTLIGVLAGGTTHTEAFLYHPPRAQPEYYDEHMRAQLATPPACINC